MADEGTEGRAVVTPFGQLSTEQALNRLGAQIAELHGMAVKMTAVLEGMQGAVSEIYIRLPEGN